MKKETFVDANVFIRYLVVDDENKAERCKKLFEKAVRGEIKLFTTTLVVAEIVWVLTKFYNWSKDEVCDNLKLILNTPHIRFAEKHLLLQALEEYKATNVDFIDAYHAHVIQKRTTSTLYSYDKDFDKLADLQRLEP